MDIVIYVVVGIAALAVAYFLFFRPKAPELTEAPKSKELGKGKPEERGAGPKSERRGGQIPGQVPEALPSADLIVAEPTKPHVSKPPPPPPRKSEHDAKKTIDKEKVASLRKGLTATRGGFIAKLTALFTGKKEIDPAILEQIEEVMLSSDVGVKTTQSILARLRERLDKKELGDADAVWAALRAECAKILSIGGGPIKTGGKPTVVLMVGVNGVGKTTTIGKLATRFRAEDKKVMLAAGDTFRAAAVAQLEVWGKRVDAEVVKGKEGADPGAVAFEATTKAKEAGADLLFVDTAGRLHTKTPLMDEIKKVRKTIAKAIENAPHETLLVLDATTGQNALTQAAMFKDAVDLTGIILTKLDGTAKGGIVLGICDELKVPVRYIGLGERAEDLRDFQAEEFVEALFGKEGDEAAAA
jgi:fused signal recognition particle receptor